jgi:two-component sensor histidine kinase
MPGTMEHGSSPVPPTGLALPSDSSAPAIARAAIAQLAGELSPALLQNLSLVATELVTNALMHATGTDPAPTMSITITRARVTLTVQDLGSSFDLDAIFKDPGPSGGWGLRVVDSLVDHWRIERPGGTRVVCEIDRPH